MYEMYDSTHLYELTDEMYEANQAEVSPVTRPERILLTKSRNNEPSIYGIKAIPKSSYILSGETALRAQSLSQETSQMIGTRPTTTERALETNRRSSK
jgi:hypothetical protein